MSGRKTACLSHGLGGIGVRAVHIASVIFEWLAQCHQRTDVEIEFAFALELVCEIFLDAVVACIYQTDEVFPAVGHLQVLELRQDDDAVPLRHSLFRSRIRNIRRSRHGRSCQAECCHDG